MNQRLKGARWRALALVLAMGMAPVAMVQAQVSVGIQIGLPGVQIGVNMPSYPMLVRIPGYPVYHDPQAGLNYFFYDGLYWVYAQDNWYVSSWYNGPWDRAGWDEVPLFVLRIPVRYYAQPPVYFQGWNRDAPPRWGEHWGREWEQRHRDWDRWDHRRTPAPAPLPRYQQKYPSDRYPTVVEHQREIRQAHDPYVPREAVSRQHLKVGGPSAAPRGTPPPRQVGPAQRAVPPGQSRSARPDNARPGQACRPGQPGCPIEPSPGRDKPRKPSG